MSISRYEKQQLYEIEKWEQREPSVVAQTMNKVTKPIGELVNFVMPKNAILGALITFNDLANFFTDTGDILREGNVAKIEELRYKDLYLSDQIAKNVSLWAKGIAGAEGGGAGVAGILGMAVDIPTIITLSLRTIQKIGLCYGYECNTEAEKMFVLNIMSAASSNNVQEKAAAITTLWQIEVAIAKNTWKKLAEQATNKQGIPFLVMTIKNLARQLGINITKRKALQAIPVLGAAVGATMNIVYITDITEAAIRTYQKRWLEENGRI